MGPRRWLVVLLGLAIGGGLLLVRWGLWVGAGWWLCLEKFKDCGGSGISGLEDLVAFEQAGGCA